MDNNLNKPNPNAPYPPIPALETLIHMLIVGLGYGGLLIAMMLHLLLTAQLPVGAVVFFWAFVVGGPLWYLWAIFNLILDVREEREAKKAKKAANS